MTLLKVNEPEWKLLHRIADGFAPAVSKQIYEALDGLKDQIPVGELTEAIADGRLADALAAVRLTPPDMTALKDALGEVVAQSAMRGMKTVKDMYPLRFDLVNPDAVNVVGTTRWYEQYGDKIITEINGETLTAVNNIVQRGFLEGIPPRVQALSIANVVGLNSRDSGAVDTYLKGLVDSGVGERRASELAGVYRSRLLRKRAEMIARTETMRASNMGQQLAWERAEDLGLLLPGEVQKVWIVTDDDRTCARCMGLEDAQVDLDGSFTEGIEGAPKSGATTTLTPPLHPMCRCAMGLVEVFPEEATGEIPAVAATEGAGIMSPVQGAPRGAPLPMSEIEADVFQNLYSMSDDPVFQQGISQVQYTLQNHPQGPTMVKHIKALQDEGLDIRLLDGALPSGEKHAMSWNSVGADLGGGQTAVRPTVLINKAMNPDEYTFANNFIHEMTHGIDEVVGGHGGYKSVPIDAIRDIYRRGGYDVSRDTWIGNSGDLWYAATAPWEAVAELTRLELTGASVMEELPALSEWVNQWLSNL